MRQRLIDKFRFSGSICFQFSCFIDLSYTYLLDWGLSVSVSILFTLLDIFRVLVDPWIYCIVYMVKFNNFGRWFYLWCWGGLSIEMKGLIFSVIFILWLVRHDIFWISWMCSGFSFFVLVLGFEFTIWFFPVLCFFGNCWVGWWFMQYSLQWYLFQMEIWI